MHISFVINTVDRAEATLGGLIGFYQYIKMFSINKTNPKKEKKTFNIIERNKPEM